MYTRIDVSYLGRFLASFPDSIENEERIEERVVCCWTGSGTRDKTWKKARQEESFSLYESLCSAFPLENLHQNHQRDVYSFPLVLRPLLLPLPHRALPSEPTRVPLYKNFLLSPSVHPSGRLRSERAQGREIRALTCT